MIIIAPFCEFCGKNKGALRHDVCKGWQFKIFMPSCLASSYHFNFTASVNDLLAGQKDIAKIWWECAGFMSCVSAEFMVVQILAAA